MQKLYLFLVISVTFPTSAWAGLIYDNGAPSGTLAARNISALISADDFVLNSASTLTSASVYTFTPLPANFSGTISASFYTNGAGIPGSLIASGYDTAPVITASSVPGTNEITFDFGSVTLAAGTYWIAFHEGTPFSPYDGTSIYLNRSVQQHGATLKSDSNLANPTTWDAAPDNTSDLAFQLYGTAAVVPEPASFVMVGLGLFAAYGVHRRLGRARSERKGVIAKS